MKIYLNTACNYGEHLYRVHVGTETAWTEEFIVGAYNEQEAIDIIADFLEDKESLLVMTYYDLYDLCEAGQTVDEFAEANGLTCAGNHGVYLRIESIEFLRGGI